MTEKNVKIVIEYEGTKFSGWQSQAQEKTIQDEIIDAIFKVTGQKVNLVGAGRTDAGVHALGQAANFIIDHQLEPNRFKDAINYYLPAEIRIKHSDEVPISFNARRHATGRRYRYLISSEPSAIYRNLRWEYPYQLDIEKLKSAASMVKGEHDFTPFCVVSSLKEDNRCVIYASHWQVVGPLLVYEIRGNRFLHSMVRSLVGAMVNLAVVKPDNNKLNLTLEEFENIMKSNSKQRIMFTAPAQGLYLVSVEYKKETSA